MQKLLWQSMKLERSDDGKLRYDPIELRDFVLEHLFEKSAHFKDEREYRIIYARELEPESDAVEHVALDFNAIERIAVRSANAAAMHTVLDNLSLRSKYAFKLIPNKYYDHPLQQYSVTYKNGDASA